MHRQHQSRPPDHLRLPNSMDQFFSIPKLEIKLLLVRRWHGHNVDMEIMWTNWSGIYYLVNQWCRFILFCRLIIVIHIYFYFTTYESQKIRLEVEITIVEHPNYFISHIRGVQSKSRFLEDNESSATASTPHSIDDIAIESSGHDIL